MEHPLDRPIWSSLQWRHSRYSEGDDRAKRYRPDFAPFAAARSDGPDDIEALGRLIADMGEAVLLQARPGPTPKGARLLRQDDGVQMLIQDLRPVESPAGIVPLRNADAPAMQALAKLTAPGPFSASTHLLGGFVGIVVDGALVAMAGERMAPPGFAEISAVCTHPAARGRGYGRALSHAVAARVLSRGEIPFLHAYRRNTAAIRLYADLGFVVRSSMWVGVLVPDHAAREPEFSAASGGPV